MWEGSPFVDPMLPFGLQQEGVEHIDHYLDDFIILTPSPSPGSQQFHQALNLLVYSCARLGGPPGITQDKPNEMPNILGHHNQ